MADDTAKQAEKVEEAPKAERKTTRPETTQTPTGRYPSPPAAAVDEDVPAGHSARTIVLSDVQWAAIDRQARKGQGRTASEWLRQFLTPYLR